MKPSNPQAFDVTNLTSLASKKPRSTYKPRVQGEFGQEEDRQTAQRSLDRFYADQAVGRKSRA